MATFPPARNGINKGTLKVVESASISTGNQNLASTIKKNTAQIKVSPGKEKTVSEF